MDSHEQSYDSNWILQVTIRMSHRIIVIIPQWMYTNNYRMYCITIILKPHRATPEWIEQLDTGKYEEHYHQTSVLGTCRLSFIGNFYNPTTNILIKNLVNCFMMNKNPIFVMIIMHITFLGYYNPHPAQKPWAPTFNIMAFASWRRRCSAGCCNLGTRGPGLSNHSHKGCIDVSELESLIWNTIHSHISYIDV